MNMRDRFHKMHRQTALFLMWSFVAIPALFSQVSTGPSTQKPGNAESIFRVRVGLAQTDVAVFDRQGRFIDNLRPDQFDLRVDGKPQPISFLELVSEGSAKQAPPSSPEKRSSRRTQGARGAT